MKKIQLALLLYLITDLFAYELPSKVNNYKKKKQTYCLVNEECSYLNFCVLNECQHKSFFPPTNTELLGTLYVFIASSMSNAGGMGGGGMIPPIISFLLNFNPHEGVIVSKLIIFCGSLTALFFAISNRNPLNLNKTSIDFNLVILMTPMILFGSTFGVYINQILPLTLLYLILAIIIGINFIKTYNAANKMSIKESSRQKQPTKSYGFGRKNNKEEEQPSYLDKDPEESKPEQISVVNKLLISYEFEKDKRIFPFYKIIFPIISFIILLMITLLKGSSEVHSIVNIEFQSRMYWLVEFTFFPISIGITLNVAKLIKEEYEYRKTIGYLFNKSDIEWNNKNLIKYSFYGFFIGILVGMMGIGSGLVLVPFFINEGFNPTVATNTSLFIVVFESFAVFFQYILLGQMNLDYGLTLGVVSACGSYFGVNLVLEYVTKTERQSTLIYIVSACLGLSFIAFTLKFSKQYTALIH